jgi:AraC-like DNA-binding protein
VVSPEGDVVRIEAAGATPEHAMSTLPGLYEGAAWSSRGTDGPYAYRYAALGDEAMTLRSSTMRGWIRGEIPPGDVVVQWILHGEGLVDVGRDPVAMRPGSPMLFPPDRSFVFEYADFDQRLVHLGRDGVDAMVEERFGISAGTARFDHRRAPSAAASATFLDAVGLASRTLRRGTSGALLRHELTRLTTAAFLDLYPPSAATSDDPARAAGADRVRRVVEHIHAHAALPLTPADLARVADVSVRTLQETFQQLVGESPMATVRRVRLDRVREALRTAVPGTTTVADIARSWGFAHLGRFAIEYRRRFGERPSETLRG